jgi:predicted nucleotidyltransferase
MRLTQQEHQVLKQSALDCFGDKAVIRLFGSRVDDARKGGDIDVLIDTALTQPVEIVRAHHRFVARVYERLGEQKLDVLIDYPTRQSNPPIYDIARAQGVVL